MWRLFTVLWCPYLLILTDIFRDMSDSLQCASDEIDTSCKAEEKYDFDGWLEGLNAIRRMLCTSNYRKLQGRMSLI